MLYAYVAFAKRRSLFSVYFYSVTSEFYVSVSYGYIALGNYYSFFLEVFYLVTVNNYRLTGSGKLRKIPFYCRRFTLFFPLKVFGYLFFYYQFFLTRFSDLVYLFIYLYLFYFLFFPYRLFDRHFRSLSFCCFLGLQSFCFLTSPNLLFFFPLPFTLFRFLFLKSLFLEEGLIFSPLLLFYRKVFQKRPCSFISLVNLKGSFAQSLSPFIIVFFPFSSSLFQELRDLLISVLYFSKFLVP